MKKSTFIIVLTLAVFACTAAMAAYHHQGELDADKFLEAYPDKAGTKLDHCALCHKGGEYEKKPDQWVTLGSCQWCHYKYGYDGAGEIEETMNQFGKDYKAAGRNAAAFETIKDDDSDGDTHSNLAEINAVTYPGDADDDPTKTPAPFRVYSLKQIEQMDQHTQFLLMNTSRSGDYYTEYDGVILENLLQDAGVLTSATGITVFAPDGWSNYHPMEADGQDMHYHVKGVYPEATYQYDQEADEALNPTDGWCDYSAPSCVGRSHGDAIAVDGGLRTILAYKREGQYLDPGVLNNDNKLDGSGPFRVVPPQVTPCPPDQSSRADNQDVTWPYTHEWDHNAGASTRSATIIRVEPLPDGMTDIDILEAGWNYVDRGKIIIYGAIDGTDSNGNGILDSEEGNSDPDPKKGRVRPMTCKETMEVKTDKGELKNMEAMFVEDAGQGQPSGMDFPYGAIKCEIQNLANGESVTLTFEFPNPVPTRARFYKITPAGWVRLPIESNDGDNVIEITFTDGDPNTDADGVANGVIKDPGVLAVPGSTSGTTAASSDGDSSSCFIKALLQ